MKIKLQTLFCFLTTVIVFLFYLHTLNYPWKLFDEQIIYNETILPIPLSFSEIIDYLTFFGINNLFEASNPFYSTISHIRGTPIDVIFNFLVFLCLKKSAFLYHLFSLILHILNTCLFFFIIDKISLKFSKTSDYSSAFRLSLVSILTLFWALHPINVESILFASNYGALVTYFFCLTFLNFYLKDTRLKLNVLNFLLLIFLYMFPLLLNEYSVTLPLIIFSYLFADQLFKDKSISYKSSFLKSLNKIMPMVFALVLFIVYFYSLPTIRTTQESSILISLERIFWLSPQIFLHYLKLMFSPVHLSIDQTDLVYLSNSLLQPYAIFSSILMYLLILITFISLFF